ncbi:MAG: zeta toxin family protein [Acidobacteriota bacterium]
MSTQPVVVVLAGPNGAGKSTVAPALLQESHSAIPFVNADTIERELPTGATAGASVRAGRIMLHRMREFGERRDSFAFETTLASRSFAPWLLGLKEAGYAVDIIFLWLPSAETALARVTDRVARGGHAVPPDTVLRRYRRGLENFFQLYLPLASTWRVYDSSDVTLDLLAQGLEDGTRRVYDGRRWRLAELGGVDEN